jgi:hypothetical protein
MTLNHQTWIDGPEADDDPAARRDADSVALLRVYKVEGAGVAIGVVCAIAKSDDIEALAMEVDRVRLEEKRGCVLMLTGTITLGNQFIRLIRMV